MKANVLFLAAVAVVPALAAAQGVRSYVPTPTPQGTTVRIYVPTPTPTHRPGAPAVAPSVANVPTHTPDRLDFGAVWNGEKTIRTFSLTSNGKGFLNAEILPKGAFHIVEYRELGLPIRSQGGQRVGKNVKLRIPYADTESRALGWDTDPDVEVEIDVAFNPKFDLATMTAGDKAASLKVSGPGPYGGWQLSIPLHGVFHGLRLMPTILVKDREPVIARPADVFDVAVDVISPGVAASGTLRGTNLPPGVAVDPVPVSVAAGKTMSTKVRVHAPAGGLPENGSPHEVRLVLEGTSAAPAGFSLSVVPSSINGGVIGRTDCGMSWGVSATLYATGKTQVTIVATDENFLEAKEISIEGKVGGVTFYAMWNPGLWVEARSTNKKSSTGLLTSDEYLRAVRDQRWEFRCEGR